MAEELNTIDVSHTPELRRMVEGVIETDRPRILQIDGEHAAVLAPAIGKRSTARGRATTADDPLWNIVGLAQSDGPGDVAEQVDRSLAEAYAPKEE